MKKLLLILVLGIVGLYANAQEILTDRTTEIARIVSTKGELIRNGLSDKTPYMMYLSATDFEGEVFYDVGLMFVEYTSRAFPKDGVILVRVADGEVLEFTNSLKESDSRDRIGALLGDTMVYYNSVLFLATREQLEKMKLGVLKIRIETSTSHIDIEYKNDKLGAAIGVHLANIDAALAGKKDIRDDF